MEPTGSKRPMPLEPPPWSRNGRKAVLPFSGQNRLGAGDGGRVRERGRRSEGPASRSSTAVQSWEWLHDSVSPSCKERGWASRSLSSLPALKLCLSLPCPCGWPGTEQVLSVNPTSAGRQSAWNCDMGTLIVTEATCSRPLFAPSIGLNLFKVLSYLGPQKTLVKFDYPYF